jgi:hypothetical protein
MKRVWIDGLIALVVSGWSAVTAGVVCLTISPSASADNVYVSGCANSVPCPEVQGFCHCPAGPTVGTCMGWGFFCLAKTFKCPGTISATGAFCTCASGC